MIRLIALLALLDSLMGQVHGQNNQTNVFQDNQGRVLTTLYNTVRGNNFAYSRVTLLGSPFLTYPIWQEGTVQVNDHRYTCKLAYNLVSGQLLCQLAGDSTIRALSPDAFTINDTMFVRQSSKVMGMDYHRDFVVLYNGPTRLLMNLTKKLEAGFVPNTNNLATTTNGYNSTSKDSGVEGSYRTLTSYYIQKGTDPPKIVMLTKKSVLRVLGDKADKLAVMLPDPILTAADLEKAVAYYNQLTKQE